VLRGDLPAENCRRALEKLDSLLAEFKTADEPVLPEEAEWEKGGGEEGGMEKGEGSEGLQTANCRLPIADKKHDPRDLNPDVQPPNPEPRSPTAQPQTSIADIQPPNPEPRSPTPRPQTLNADVQPPNPEPCCPIREPRTSHADVQPCVSAPVESVRFTHPTCCGYPHPEPRDPRPLTPYSLLLTPGS
jgi:hypothetical protein